MSLTETRWMRPRSWIERCLRGWFAAASSVWRVSGGAVRTAEREFLVEESLQKLEEEFENLFVRIHRNCLVAREAISGFERNAEESESGWAVVIRGTGEKLPVSRRQHAVVKQFR